MGDKKVIAIAASDIHLHLWTQYNEDGRRDKVGEMFLYKLNLLQKKYKCPVLLPGDLIHTPKNLSNRWLNHYIPLLKEELKFPVISISGNHDIDGVNNISKEGSSHLGWLIHLLPRLCVIDNAPVILTQGVQVWGIPYYDHNIGLVERLETITKAFTKGNQNILLIHTDLPNAKDTDNYTVGSVENIPLDKWGDLFDKFDLVLCGHIHKFQKLRPNTYMVGAPYHTRVTDMGCKMGILLIKEDLSVEFVDMKLPEFKVKEPGVKVDDYHIWIDKKKDIEEEDKGTPTTRNSFYTKDRVKLGKAYIKVKGIKDNKKKNHLINALKNE